ncbi:MAG: nucleotidyltransferase family protein [Armatimonadota bacterium]
MPADGSGLGAILLAAGSSTRLGQPKQLLRWQGKTLLRNAVDVTLSTGASPVVVVLGSRAEEMMPEINGLSVQTVVNPDWDKGMGSSLQAGLLRLEEITVPESVLVLLSDQPLVTASHLHAIIEASRVEQRLAVASEYAEGVLGPPCLFTRPLFAKLKALSGTQGARALLGTLPPDQLSRVSFPDGLLDIDTMADWERLQKRAL